MSLAKHLTILVILSFLAPACYAQFSSGTGMYTRTNTSNPYKRTAGFGFTNPYHASVNYPTFGIPQSSGNGFYQVPSGKSSLPMWKAASGYLYPWAPRPKSFNFGFRMPILVTRGANQSASPAVPPLTVVINDMEKFISKNQQDNKISSAEANALIQRLASIKSKEHRQRITGKGNFKPSDEALIRRQLDQIGSQLSKLLSR